MVVGRKEENGMKATNKSFKGIGGVRLLITEETTLIMVHVKHSCTNLIVRQNCSLQTNCFTVLAELWLPLDFVFSTPITFTNKLQLKL